MKQKKFFVESYYNADFTNFRSREFFGSVFRAIGRFYALKCYGNTNGMKSMRLVYSRRKGRQVVLLVTAWAMSKSEASKLLALGRR